MLHIAYIGIGSNLGDREGNIKRGLSLLEENLHIQITDSSSFYNTEPVGYKDQDDFLNGVIKISTTLEAHDLMKSLHSIEQLINLQPRVKWGPRWIDLDMLFYDNLTIEEDNLIIPHPRLHERGFVLMPLVEIAPDLIHPRFKLTVKELLDRIEDRNRVIKYSKIASRE